MAVEDDLQGLTLICDWAPKMRSVGLKRVKFGMVEIELADYFEEPAKPVDPLPLVTEADVDAMRRELLEASTILHPLQDPRTYNRTEGVPRYRHPPEKSEDE